MGFMVNFKGRRAIQQHLKGNQASDRGNYQEAKQLHDKALAMYEEVYAKGCRDVSVMMAYATLLMRYGEYLKTKDLLLECEKMKITDPKVRRQMKQNYSVCQWRLGNLDKAIDLLRDVERNGKSSFVYTVLGYYLIEKAIQTGDFEEALAYNMEAYEYDEDDAGTLDNLGQLYYAMGEVDKAYDYFARAYKEKPTQPTTLYFIAKINYERGNMEKAKQFIEKCLAGNYSALCSISREDVQALAEKIG